MNPVVVLPVPRGVEAHAKHLLTVRIQNSCSTLVAERRVTQLRQLACGSEVGDAEGHVVEHEGLKQKSFELTEIGRVPPMQNYC